VNPRSLSSSEKSEMVARDATSRIGLTFLSHAKLISRDATSLCALSAMTDFLPMLLAITDLDNGTFSMTFADSKFVPRRNLSSISWRENGTPGGVQGGASKRR